MLVLLLCSHWGPSSLAYLFACMLACLEQIMDFASKSYVKKQSQFWRITSARITRSKRLLSNLCQLACCIMQVYYCKRVVVASFWGRNNKHSNHILELGLHICDCFFSSSFVGSKQSHKQSNGQYSKQVSKWACMHACKHSNHFLELVLHSCDCIFLYFDPNKFCFFFTDPSLATIQTCSEAAGKQAINQASGQGNKQAGTHASAENAVSNFISIFAIAFPLYFVPNTCDCFFHRTFTWKNENLFQASKHISKQASQQASKATSEWASKQARKQAGKQQTCMHKCSNY